MIKLYKAKQLFDNSDIKEKTSYANFKMILNHLGIVKNDVFIILNDESLEDLNPYVHFEDMTDRLLGINPEYLSYYQMMDYSKLIECIKQIISGWQETATDLNLPFKKNNHND